LADDEQEWEAEQQRRRDDEGEHFDEEAYEFEKSMMARRRELTERQIRQDEETHQAYRDLDARGLAANMYERERRDLERREQQRREALAAELRVLEDEAQEYGARMGRNGKDDDQDEPVQDEPVQDE